jgi:hypothetical protein
MAAMRQLRLWARSGAVKMTGSFPGWLCPFGPSGFDLRKTL